MDQRHLARKTLHRLRCRGAEIAQPEEVLRGNAVRMSCDLAIEDMNLAAGQTLAQVIVAAAIAEAEFHDRAAMLFCLHDGPVEAAAQRFQTPDRAVEPAGGGRTHRWREAPLLPAHGSEPVLALAQQGIGRF